MKAEYTRHLTVRLPAEHRQALADLAQAEEISLSDLVREIIANRLGEEN